MIKALIFAFCLVAATQLEKDLQLWPMITAALSQNETVPEVQTAPQQELEKAEKGSSQQKSKKQNKKEVAQSKNIAKPVIDLDALESQLKPQNPEDKIADEFTLNKFGAKAAPQNVIKSIYINDDEFNAYLEAFINDEMAEYHWEEIKKKFALSPEQRRLLSSYLNRDPANL